MPVRSCAGLLVAVALLATAGCANRHDQLAAFLNARRATVATAEYTVMPPDAITIHAPRAQEIDGVVQRVRPDGKITLRLLGEVHVAGLTTTAVADKLEHLLTRYYVDPQVVVETAEFRSQEYYVFGQVRLPGPKPYTGRNTVLQALADAQPNNLAWTAQIRLVRPDPAGGDPRIITIDLDNLVTHGATEHDVLLQPGDIVEVPPTPLAWVGLRVRELLYPVEPILDTYTRPAAFMAAQDYYEDRDGRAGPPLNLRR